jgi:hypothetical protein
MRILPQLSWPPGLTRSVQADVDSLARLVKSKLKKIQYRPYLINGCLAATGLTIEPW